MRVSAVTLLSVRRDEWMLQMHGNGRRRLTPGEVRSFQNAIYRFYATHGRKLPWRATRNPYHILVSELMLQQTRVERVLDRYGRFIERFPDFASLARAPLRAVLDEWHGMGYNRRALALKRIAERVVEEYGGRLPRRAEELERFPGIGRATASAIVTFAFNEPSVFVETNIRTVFIRFFFRRRRVVRDEEILARIEETLDRKRARKWYWALMDYGTMLKKRSGNLSRRSAHYRRQSPFQGSRRQMRGRIIREIVRRPALSESEVGRMLGVDREEVREILGALEKDGLVQRRGRRITVS
jgi:A/G-specific adenine glycosylase